jgi:vacuolar protein sorting-associated protein 41
MVEASDDQGDTKNTKGKQPERDENHAAEDEETIEESDIEEEDDDEGEEDEPKLKYARLTAHLLPVYRNGDATSACLVAGDKMVGLGEVVHTRSTAEPYM